MKILVTGGAGFIGSHLTERLLLDGHSVVVLDDLSTGRRERLDLDHARLSLQVGDIADQAGVRTAMQGCQALVHLAAVASVEASVRDPIGTNRTNLQGTVRLLDEAARQGVRRVVYASSAAVYGDAEILPISEEATKRPLSPYAADKLAGEHYLAYYHRSDKLDGTAFRFFNVFGPRQDPASPYSGVISIFLDRARSGEAITVFGDGEQTRDFVYVGDVVEALVAGLLANERPEQLPIYNVAGGNAVSLRRLLEVVGTLEGVNAPLRLSFGKARQGDIRHSLADVRRIRAAFGWQAQTAMAEGLHRTLQSLPKPVG